MLNVKKLDTLLDYLEKIETSFSVLIIIIINFILILDIICRYFFFGSLGWAQEVSLQLIIWVMYFTLCVLIRKKTLISVEFFFNKFSRNIKKIVSLLREIIIFLI